MLNIPQLAQIKARDPYAYEALRALQAAVNSLAQLVGVDPSGSLTPPAVIGGISVSASGGVADISITDNSAVTKAIRYFVEYDTSQNFTAPYVIYLGPSRNARLAVGGLTLYFRAYSQYQGSEPSAPVTYGNPPASVACGGSGPALQASQGSGTASGAQGGSGFGE